MIANISSLSKAKRTLATLMLVFMFFTFALPQAAFADPEGNDGGDDFGVKLENGKLVPSGAGFNEDATGDEAANELLNRGLFVLQFITGAATIFFVAILIFKAVKYANSGDRPQERQAAQSGILGVLIGAAIAGSATFLIGIVSNLFILN